jgi:hypothetical protein
MKRTIILTLAMLMVFSIPLTALATEGEVNVSGEIQQETNVQVQSPDTFVYKLKRLYEQFRLMTTFNEENKLNMHIELAGKRLQELGGLDHELKNEFSAQLYSDFLANIEKAIILTVELKEQEKQMDLTLTQLQQVVLDGETLIAQLESEIDLEIDEETEETKELARIAPAAVAHIDAEIISELRAEGYGYGQIALLVAISEQNEIELDEAKLLVSEHKGIGKVAKGLGLHLGNMNKNGKQKAESEEADKTEASEEEGTENESNEEEATSVEITNKAEVNVETIKSSEKKGNGNAYGLEKKENQKTKGNAAVEIKANLGIKLGNNK